MLLDPGSARYDSAWEPAGLSANHSTQLLSLLRTELLRPTHSHGAVMAGAGGAFSDSGSWPPDPDSPTARTVAGTSGAMGLVVGPDDDSVAAAGEMAHTYSRMRVNGGLLYAVCGYMGASNIMMPCQVMSHGAPGRCGVM